MDAKIKNYIPHEYSEEEIFLTAETNPFHLPGMQYMKPLDEYIIHEEEPLSDKQIEALSHLMKSKQQYKPMDWTMLAISIVWAILVFLLLLI